MMRSDNTYIVINKTYKNNTIECYSYTVNISTLPNINNLDITICNIRTNHWWPPSSQAMQPAISFKGKQWLASKLYLLHSNCCI